MRKTQPITSDEKPSAKPALAATANMQAQSTGHAAEKTASKKEKQLKGREAIRQIDKLKQKQSQLKIHSLVEDIKTRKTTDPAYKPGESGHERGQPELPGNPRSKKTLSEPSSSTATTDRYPHLRQLLMRQEELQRQQDALVKKAEQIRQRMDHVASREGAKLAEGLRDCFGIYVSAEAHPDPEHVYDIFRSLLLSKGDRIQSNTKDEALLVKYVFSHKSRKQISEYATVIRYAKKIGVTKNHFIDWYKTTTLTKILEEARQTQPANSKENMNRALELLLRLFEVREQWPLGTFDYPQELANSQLHPKDNLIFAICRIGPRYHPDITDDTAETSKAQTEVRALHFIPPNVDVTNDLMNRLAKMLASRVDEFEKEVEVEEEKAWMGDLTNKLTEQELGQAYKSADRWADRMQASIAEDQEAFEKKRVKIRKLRKESRK